MATRRRIGRVLRVLGATIVGAVLAVALALAIFLAVAWALGPGS